MTWRAEAQRWAESHFPREACGLVVVQKGRKRFVPCTNIAEGDNHFTIPPEEYAEAEDAGEIVAVFHSHCNINADPSEGDLVSCEATGLEWHIISLPTGSWTSFRPSGYVAPLVGRTFHHGVLDCYQLIKDWYSIERGVTLPDPVRQDEWWHKGQNLYLDNYQSAGFVTVDDLEPGDVLLMQVASLVPNHAAIYLGDDMILHHVHGRLSSRDVFGGYWRKVWVKTLRYSA